MYKRRFLNKYKKGGVKKYQQGSEWDDATGMIYLDQNMPVSQQIVTDKSTKEDKKIAEKNRRNLIETAPSVEDADKAGLFKNNTEKQKEKNNRKLNRQFAQSMINQTSGGSGSIADNITGGLNFWDYLDVGLSTAGMTPGWGAAADFLNTGQNLLQSAGNLLVGDFDESWYDLKSAGTSALSIIPATQFITPGLKTKQVYDKTQKVKKIVDKSNKTKYINKVDDVSTGGGMSITKGNKTQFQTTNTKTSTPKKIDKVGSETNPIVVKGEKVTDPPLLNAPNNSLIQHPYLFNRGISNTGLNYKYVKPSFGTRSIRNIKGLPKMWNEGLGMGKPLVQWRGIDAPSLFRNPFGKEAFWRTNVQRQITPNDVLGYSAFTLAANAQLKRFEDKIESDQQIIDDINSQNEAFKADSSAYVDQNIQKVNPGWNPNISAGANLFQIGVQDPGAMAKILQELGYDPSVSRSEKEIEQLMIKRFPDTVPTINDAILLFDAEQKQMGGAYMGVPQQQPVGDEGYMGQMKQFQMGGQNLPGGNMSNIPGSDAVQFNGQTHDEGGIMLDPKTEVEDGETMDKVNMKNKGPKDYFFSSYLKKGGMSYADHHKNILARGGDQKEIDYLAKMQEKSAGRNPNSVQTAGHGGYKKYANGGPEQSVYGPDHAGYERALEASGYTGYGADGTVSGADVGEAGYKSVQGKNKQMVEGQLTHTGYYGEIGPAEREDFFNRNKDVMEKIGVTNWEDFDPATMTDDFQREFNTYLSNEYNTNEEFRTNLTNEGITNLEGLISTAGFHDKGHKSKKLDGNYGSYTHGKTSFFDKEKTPDPEVCTCENTSTGAQVEYPCDGELPPECKEGEVDKGCPCGTVPETYSEECCKDDSSTRENYGSLVGAAQLLPAAYAFSEGPDYMTEHKMASPGAIIPERLSKTHLERVDMNADRARNQADYQSMNKFVETAGLGSSGMAAKMAAYSKKQQGNLMITDAENKANTEIGNQELLADQTRKTTNVQNALDASKFNVTSQLEANKQNAIMEGTVDEFNRAADAAVKDRRLMAIDNATKTMAGMYTDRLKLQSQERMADAISGQTGIAERNRYSMQLLNSGNYTGTSDPKYIEAMDAYNRMNAPKQMRYGGYKRRY